MRRNVPTWALRLSLLSLAALAPLSAPNAVRRAEAAEPTYTLVEAWPKCPFDMPIGTASARDGTDRTFVVQRGGKILVLPKWRGAGPVPTAKVFLDLTSLMTEKPIEEGHGGLLTMAVAPDYKTSGRFAVFYGTGTEKPANPYRAVVAVYKRSAADPDVADPASGVTVLSIPKLNKIHYGGGLCFGPDGMLYVGTGEQGLVDDPAHIAQDTRVLEGKVLRLDVSNASAQQPYAVPADNPWANAPGVRPEIWAYGVRNPWRMGFDASGALWLGDPGQKRREELDVVSRGGNLGWAMMEADQPVAAGAKAADYVAPVFAYGRETGSCVIAGQVYRGQRCASLANHHVFADHMSGKVLALPVSGGRATGAPKTVIEKKEAISSIDEDAQNELLLTCIDESKIFTLVPAP